MLIDPRAAGDKRVILASKIAPSQMLPAGCRLRENNFARSTDKCRMPHAGKAASRVEN